VFASSVVNQLPQDYQHSNLLEITENSYLVENALKLPIFGIPFPLQERSNLKKGEFYLDKIMKSH
jgi:hypothetical protein